MACGGHQEFSSTEHVCSASSGALTIEYQTIRLAREQLKRENMTLELQSDVEAKEKVYTGK